MDYENHSIDPTSLESWVINKCDQWRDHYESNYKERFDEYYRLWRGQWAVEDTMRSSERGENGLILRMTFKINRTLTFLF